MGKTSYGNILSLLENWNTQRSMKNDFIVIFRCLITRGQHIVSGTACGSMNNETLLSQGTALCAVIGEQNVRGMLISRVFGN